MAKTSLKHFIKVQLGDWSGDGHSITETICIKSNLTLVELRAAYKKASKKLKVDLIEEVCDSYQDHVIPSEVLCKLFDGGINNKLVKDWFDGVPESYLVDELEWFNLIMEVCKLGEPNFRYKKVCPGPTFCISGYGLFE